MSSFFKKLSKAVPTLTQGFVAGNNMRRLNEDEQRKQAELLAKQYAEGISVAPDGTVGTDQNFYTPGTDSYRRSSRQAELKRMEHPDSVLKPGKQPLTAGNIMGLKQAFGGGNPLPDDLKDLPVDSGYSNFFTAPRAGADLLTASEVQGLKDGTLAQTAPDRRVAPGYVSATRAPSPGVALASPDQQTIYETRMGLEPGSAKGLTMSQFTGGVSTVRAQDQTNQRQGNAITAADDREKRRLEQGAAQHEENKRIEREKMNDASIKDLTNKIQTAGLNSMANDFDIIDQYTGLFSSPKPNIGALPKPMESAAGRLPIIGGGLQDRMVRSRGDGPARVTQAVNNYFNSAMKVISGGAVTDGEELRNRIAKGMALGATQEAIADGLRAAKQVHSQTEGTFFAGENPEAVAEYRKRPGAYQTLDDRIQARMSKSQQRAASAKKLNIKPGTLDMIDSTPVRKQYSKKLNKTKMIYADGREEIVDGQR